MHPVCAGQNRCKCTKEGDEPPKENNFPAVAHEQILAYLQARLAKPDVSSVAHEQPEAQQSPDQITDIVSNDGRCCRSRNHRHDTDPVRRSRIDGGCHQGRFSRHWDAHAFEHHRGKQDPETIGLDQILNPDSCVIDRAGHFLVVKENCAVPLENDLECGEPITFVPRNIAVLEAAKQSAEQGGKLIDLLC